MIIRRVGMAALLGAVVITAGCSSETRRSLGLEKSAPDEFRVVQRAPLDLPPDFGLRPPRPGADRPTEVAVRDQARNNVFGITPAQSKETAGLSVGEAALLKQAGAGAPDPSIRELVNRETAQLAQEDSSFVDKLVFWREPDPPGVVVDAQKETQRLRENSALGKPPTTGETPVIQRKKRALLEGLF